MHPSRQFFVVVLFIFIVEVVSVILMYVYYGKVEGLIVKEMNTKPETFDSLQKEVRAVCLLKRRSMIVRRRYRVGFLLSFFQLLKPSFPGEAFM